MPTLDLEAKSLNHTAGTALADADAIDATLAQSGDPSAFERLYRRHVARIHSLARRMLGASGHEADEMTQEIFVRTWQKLGTFRGEAAFGTWLHRLAVNVILAGRAKLGQHRQRHSDAEDVLDNVAGKASRPDLGMDFEVAMLQVPDGARQVFVLHDVEGYRHEEIAGMMGITAGTSKSQLHHARMALRKHLDR
jgi:RNA polymerase sigma-70 factor, ECF subfamily